MIPTTFDLIERLRKVLTPLCEPLWDVGLRPAINPPDPFGLDYGTPSGANWRSQSFALCATWGRHQPWSLWLAPQHLPLESAHRALHWHRKQALLDQLHPTLLQQLDLFDQTGLDVAVILLTSLPGQAHLVAEQGTDRRAVSFPFKRPLL